MRKMLRIITAIVVAGLLLTPTPSWAWGALAHQYIMGRAIDLLPPELKPLFEAHRTELVVRVLDPDMWRLVGWAEDPNHFLDFGVKEYGPFPFTALPKDYGAALEKFGPEVLERNGRLPWRLAEIHGRLRRSFEDFGRGSPNAASNSVLFAAIAAHYVQDAHQPLHATDNYDGQLTGQRGVHSRFERELFERFQSRLKIVPAAPVPMLNARDTAFDVLLASYQHVDAILKADQDAAAGREMYDDAYYEKFLAGAQPVMEKRLTEAISATAGMIIGAWEQAGKPAVRVKDTRPVEKISR
ncbi:MAG TPA: hypothetical protein VIY56_06980 [Vicinamibacterales bacterium]